MRPASSCVALAVVLGGLMAVIGCSTVTTTVPLGEPATAEEAKQFVGVWMVPKEGPLHVRHAGGNRLRLASVSWDEKKSEYQLTEVDCLITKDDELLIVGPKVETFAEAVADGTLDGQIEEAVMFKTIKLEPTARQLSEFVTPSKAAEQFTFERPLVLRRIQRFEEKQK